MHPQTTKIVEQKSQEDMMDLLMKMNERLAETEQALEKAMKEKQGESTFQPPEIVPTVTTSPPIATTIVRSTVPTSVAEISTGVSTAATITTPDTSMSIEELMKAMEQLKLQVSELKEAKEKLEKLEVSYDKSKMIVAERTKEVKEM